MDKKEFFDKLYKRGVQLALIGALVGITAGIIVTFFALASEILAEHSANIYKGIQARPEFVPLLFLTLAIGAFGIGTLTYLLPLLRGNGVPQTEGASRGLLKLKWYQMLPAMAAASLASAFLGLTAGAEGPCMFIGGMCGEGMGRLFKCSDMERRYQITGGACAGVAVAANAPLTGIVFALEEAHRRFTPSILICAFSSVITALVTRNLLYRALDLEVVSAFSSFVLPNLPLIDYLYVLFAAIVSGLLGALLVKATMFSKRLFNKMTAFKGILKYFIPFFFAGVIGLITVYATGSGHSLIEALGTEGGARAFDIEKIFSTPIVATLVIILLLRIVALIFNISADMPIGIFIPILAIGALVGALMSRLCVLMGMSEVCCDAIVLISLATLFAATVKAPLTAIILTVEFTWQMTLLLPVVLGVFIGYMISEIFKNKPLYDLLLEDMLERSRGDMVRYEYSTTVERGSVALGQSIRDILWPDGVLINAIDRGGDHIIPSSVTVIYEGDRITVQADTDDIADLETRVEEIVKPHSHIPQKHGFKLPNAIQVTKIEQDDSSATDETTLVDDCSANGESSQLNDCSAINESTPTDVSATDETPLNDGDTDGAAKADDIAQGEQTSTQIDTQKGEDK